MFARYQFIIVFILSLFSFGCQTSNEKKQQKIEQKLLVVNQKNSDKYNELILPPFIKEYDVNKKYI